MLDINFIRQTPEALDAALQKRGAAHQSGEILALDEQHRGLLVNLQQKQAQRNQAAKAVGEAKAKGENAKTILAEMALLKGALQALEAEERTLNTQLKDVLAGIPNTPLPDVPVGKDEDDNVEIRRWGTPAAMDNPQPHEALGENLGQMNFEKAAQLSGARFVWLQGDIARLERALANFMLENLNQRGFTEVSPPLMVNTPTMFGTGQLPKFADDQYRLENDDKWLIPTAEVVLTNYAQNETFTESQLPMRLCAHTPCFRKEAGSAGRDTKGILRQHQFYKVEMVQLTTPETSDAALEFMTETAEHMLQQLGLPYRTVMLCTGDMGFGARKTYDIEVWVPSQNTYREISSCSTCGDFQARRMNAKYKDADGKRHFLHTLNGSGLAVGRTLLAVLENYQQPNGSIAIPEVLQGLMGGQKVIEEQAA